MSIRGRFYLRLTSNGNLTGEFSHNQDTRIYTESADRTSAANPLAPFLGTYRSSWRQTEINEGVAAELTIIPVNGKDRMFGLQWRNPDTIFRGRTMIGEGMLIGHYWCPEADEGQLDDDQP